MCCLDPDHVLQATLAAGGLRGQRAQFEAPAAPRNADEELELDSQTIRRSSSVAPAVGPVTIELPSADVHADHAEDSQAEPVSQQSTPPLVREGVNSGAMDSGSSSGECTPSEDSPAFAPEQSRPGGAQESPIRGLIIPESPADSRAIAENVLRLLC